MSTITTNQNRNQEKDKKLSEKNITTTITTNNIDYYDDDFSNSSILEFLNKEQECFNNGDNLNDSEIDIESIFEEINRLSDNNDQRPIEEIIHEAELLLKQQQKMFSIEEGCGNGDCNIKKKDNNNDRNIHIKNKKFSDVIEDVCLDSVISQESAPKELSNSTLKFTEGGGSETSDSVSRLICTYSKVTSIT